MHIKVKLLVFGALAEFEHPCPMTLLFEATLVPRDAERPANGKTVAPVRAQSCTSACQTLSLLQYFCEHPLDARELLNISTLPVRNAVTLSPT